MPNEEIGHALFSLNAITRRFVENYTHKREHERLTGASQWVLRFIAESTDTPVYLRDIEKRFGISRSTASKMVDLLVKKGFLERRTNAMDMRLRQLVLTERAKDLLETIRSDQEIVDNALTTGFSEEEKNTALTLLNRMRENIQTAAGMRQLTERSETTLD